MLHGNGKIYVGMPRERVMIPAFVDNRDNILAEIGRVQMGAGYYQAEGHRVDRNRDRIVKAFLQAEGSPEWLLMLDTDMEHPTTIGARLVAHRKPIVGGLYFHRGESHDPFAFKGVQMKKDEYGRLTPHWIPMREEVYKYLEDHHIPMRDGSLIVDDGLYSPLVEVDAVATGAMMIHRSVLEIMEKPIFEYRNFGTSEDLSFCQDAKDNYGIPIYCDFSTQSGHFAFVPMGQTQFRLLYRARGVTFSNYSKGDAAKWVGAYLEIPESQALEKINAGNAHMVGDYWKAQFNKKTPSSKEILRFYNDPYTGQLYIIELLHWNFTQTFHSIRSNLIDIREKKVAEIGSGIGTVAIQMSVQMNDVDAYEINDTLRDFSDLRWKDIQENIVSHLGKLEWKKAFIVTSDFTGIYDIVIAIDVLEHFDEPQLRTMIKDIATSLKVNGRLIFHVNWKQQDLYPMHFDHSAIWEDLLKENGFQIISSSEAMKTL